VLHSPHVCRRPVSLAGNVASARIAGDVAPPLVFWHERLTTRLPVPWCCPQPSTAVRFLVEFATVVIPVLVAMTLESAMPERLLVCVIGAALAVAFLAGRALGRPFLDQGRAAPYAERTFATGRPPFLTHLRAGVFLLTVMAILACDTPAFPRHHLKTEVAGVSLMDLGVGVVVIAGALASKQARAVLTDPVGLVTGQAERQGAARAARLLGAGAGAVVGRASPLSRSLDGALSAVLPCLAIGLLRFASTAATNYQGHVSEYGVHWNFFLTLALVPPLAVLAEAATTMLGVTASLGASMTSSYDVLADAEGRDEEDEKEEAGAKGGAAAATAAVAARLGVRSPATAPGAAGQWVVDALPLVAAGLSLSAVHQAWLSLSGGFDWVVGAHRLMDGSAESSLYIELSPWALLDANREGVTSLAGYVSLALIGVGIGRGIFLPVARHRAAAAPAQRRRQGMGVDSASRVGRGLGDWAVGSDEQEEEEEEAQEGGAALPSDGIVGLAAALFLLAAMTGCALALLLAADGPRPSGHSGPTPPGAPSDRGFSPLSPSRRTANLAYVLLVTAAVSLLLALLILIHVFVVPTPAIARRVRQEADAQAAARAEGPATSDEEEVEREDEEEEAEEAEEEEAAPTRGGRSSSAVRRRRPAAASAVEQTRGRAGAPAPAVGGVGPWLVILDAANRHPLTLFLVGNVLTGATNLALQGSMVTLPDWASLPLLAWYVASCAAIVAGLDAEGIVLLP